MFHILTCSILSANDIERVSITYDYYSDNPNETPEQAEYKAIERAKEKALEDKFGVDVSSISSSFILNQTNGETVHSATNFFSLGGSSVRGEWLETTKQKVEKEYKNGFWCVKVHIEGKVRGKSKSQIEIHASLVNNSHDRTSRDMFYDGDDIFLHFSSPVSGYLCVYLIDEEKNAFCLLPYKNNTTGHQVIKANEEYLFFSQQTDSDADEYTLNTSREVEHNAVYIVFSPNSIIKANDSRGDKNWRNEQLPRTLPYANFLKWLSRNQTKDPDMVVKTELILIRNKK